MSWQIQNTWGHPLPPGDRPSHCLPRTPKSKCTAVGKPVSQQKPVQAGRWLPAVERARAMLGTAGGGDHLTEEGLEAQEVKGLTQSHSPVGI